MKFGVADARLIYLKFGVVDARFAYSLWYFWSPVLWKKSIIQNDAASQSRRIEPGQYKRQYAGRPVIRGKRIYIIVNIVN